MKGLESCQNNRRTEVKRINVESLDASVAGVAITNRCETNLTKNEKHLEPIEGLEAKIY
ncbi:MAG: hypothetical protein ACOC85_05030 [Thermoplasmatota archaeon]